MPHDWWTRKHLVFILAFVSLACVIALVAAGLAFPEPVSGAEIGPEWQCNRLAFVFTICSRVSVWAPPLMASFPAPRWRMRR